MTITRIALEEIAYARSGDKGNSANIGVIAYTAAGYEVLKQRLSSDEVKRFFAALEPSKVVRYEMANLWALNFVLYDVLAGGGSRSLRLDSQGKALGQAILNLSLSIQQNLIPACRPRQEIKT
ncbi:MAG: hypothetical protein Q8K75_01095 [Chlamydiales bacterium]|nr:hypothetical protein [Chlamydiales bacterium]